MKKTFRLFSLFTRLGRDEHGSILIQFTVYIVVLLGMIGLALDGGRFLLLHNDLQDLADAAAIAGAARLDGTSNALINADYDARNLLTNDPRWSNVSGLKILSGTAGVQFYSSLNPDTVTADPMLAKYIKVTTGSWQVAPTFLVAVGAVANNSTSASAVASSTFPSCAPIQSYLCGGSFPATTTSGTMFQLLAKASGGSGNWGIVGADDYTVFFSQDLPSSCQNALVDQRTGNGQHKDIPDGINVRFDQKPNGNPSGLVTIAAPNVIDGFQTDSSCTRTDMRPSIPGAPKKNGKPGDPILFDPNNYSLFCNASTPTDKSCPLPRDRNFDANGIGNKPNSDDLNAYWKNQHPGENGGNWPTGLSRYDVYKQETANAYSWRTTPPQSTVENPAPQCYSKSNNPGRRVLSVAILDVCPSGNSGGPYVFRKYANFFITEEVAAASQPVVYVEFIETHVANDGGALHHIVQLVR
jgi:Flp pilus assembly protein TadG